MDWGSQQANALTAIGLWLEQSDQQVFRLFGYAGTGKTTLAKHIAEQTDGRVCFAAFTGKAAQVLRTKGCRSATTIHKLIYIPTDKSRKRLRDLRAVLAKLSENDPNRARYERLVKEEEDNLHRPAFALNLESELVGAKLVIIDECSMVDQKMAEDLMSFDVKILVLGDPMQLPPVKGSGYFINAEPDCMLTDIHRQAKESPIIRLAHEIREHRRLPLGDNDLCRVISKADSDEIIQADQLLVGRNKTRLLCNNHIRNLIGRADWRPAQKDKLVCLRNDHEIGLLNGELWEVLEAHDHGEEWLLSLEQYDDGRTVTCSAHEHYFRGAGDELEWFRKKEAQEFDYGYALTTHKAQGSQWGHVVVLDESQAFRSSAMKWLYTAVTRAEHRLTVVKEYSL